MMGPLCEHRWRQEMTRRIRDYHAQAARDGWLRQGRGATTPRWRSRLAVTLRRLADGLEPLSAGHDYPPALRP